MFLSSLAGGGLEVGFLRPFGLPMFLTGGQSDTFHIVRVTSSQDLPFQISRIALALTLYLFARILLADCDVENPCACFSVNISTT
mmetsp:Transcript_72872/g.194538  ORF Transcript_72872/g.194538 Transcript_72872/m.194538 type:complete len:85 (-) Transcript_72872:230-484(-)